MSYRLYFYINIYHDYYSNIGLACMLGDLPACPLEWTKVKGKSSDVPAIYILQPVFVFYRIPDPDSKKPDDW